MNQMRSHSLLSLAGGALLLAFASPGGAQAKPPVISARQFVSGSIKIVVTGAFSIDDSVAINVQASFGDGGMTWLQFGASGSDQPNAGITYSELGEVGITVARGKDLVTGGIIVGEKSECSGTAQVTATMVSGRYKCVGLTSYSQATRKMGTVSVDVTFTAKS
jgi:hypothetical protein